MRRISLDARRCSISKIPAIQQRESFRIRRTAPSEMHRERSWTVIDIRGSDRSWRLISAIGNLADARVKIDVVEASVQRIFGKAHDAPRACRKIPNAYRIIVRVECEIFDPLVSEVRMKIGILVRCRKIVSLIP